MCRCCLLRYATNELRAHTCFPLLVTVYTIGITHHSVGLSVCWHNACVCPQYSNVRGWQRHRADVCYAGGCAHIHRWWLLGGVIWSLCCLCSSPGHHRLWCTIAASGWVVNIACMEPVAIAQQCVAISRADLRVVVCSANAQSTLQRLGAPIGVDIVPRFATHSCLVVAIPCMYEPGRTY